MLIEHVGYKMDADTKLLVEITPAELKTISSAMVIRQARMRNIAKEAVDVGDYTFVDAANIEAEKSYAVGRWAEGILNSLVPDRIEDEWFSDHGYLRRKRDVALDPFYPVDDEF